MPPKELPKPSDSIALQKVKKLTFALMGSLALNAGLLATLTFSQFYEAPPTLPRTLSAARGEREGGSLPKVLQGMEKLSFRELVALLTNREKVEEGYLKRDLALATLVAYHHFHLEKALGSKPLQRRPLTVAQGGEIEVFPALQEGDFEAILRFAYQEKWPLTPRGLFLLLQKGASDESLQQAFFVTPEFYALDLLFQKSGALQPAPLLLSLVKEGNFELLQTLAQEQAKGLDISADLRRELLLSYLTLHSETAAELLLKTDFSFALKRLDDSALLALLSLLPERSGEAKRFCVELLKSPRSDAIWKESAAKLYRLAGEAAPEGLDPKGALARFGGVAKREVAPAPVTAEKRRHVVKEGESLWKIARAYRVKIEEIVELNGIDPGKLRPGMTLDIPQGTGSEPPR